MNIASFVVERAKETPNSPAVSYPQRRGRDGTARYTHYSYRQLDLESDRIARGLDALALLRSTRAPALLIGLGDDVLITCCGGPPILMVVRFSRSPPSIGNGEGWRQALWLTLPALVPQR